MFDVMIVSVNSEISIWDLRDLVDVGFAWENVVHHDGVFLIELDVIWVVFDADVDTSLGGGVFSGDEVESFFFVIEQVKY